MAFYAGFRGVTWDAEQHLHLMPLSAPLAPGAPMICGKQLPLVISGDTECEPGVIDKRICPRCNKTVWKVRRRSQEVFAAEVTRDLDQLEVTDEPPR